MKNLKRYLIIAVIAIIAIKVIEANPIGFVPYVEPTQGSVNLSQANLNNSQAAKVYQDIRRQNEMDNGLSVNMFARVVTGQGITDFERLASVGFAALMVCGLAPGLLIIVVIVLVKITKSRTTEA